MVMFLALSAALAYGFSDFLGGAVARRSSALKALALCVPIGLLALLVTAGAVGGTPSVKALAWGACSGLAGGSGLIMFYRALARGPMSVVAPVSALAAAVLPIAVGTLRGERLNTGVLIGVALCLVAIGLVSMEERAPAARGRLLDNGPVLATASGAGFGVFFILLKQAGGDSGLWPLVSARGAGCVVILAALFVVTRRAQDGPSTLFDARTFLIAAVAGVLDALANIFYFLAVRDGLLSLAAVLTSLYPAVTVLLARLVYSERLRTVQRVGLAVAVAGVALVTTG